MEILGKEIVASKGKYLHRKGDTCYFGRCTLLSGETLDSFEEVDSIPEEDDRPPFKERVISRVRERYSVDDELAILRQRDTKPEEYEEYNAFVEQIKAEER